MKKIGIFFLFFICIVGCTNKKPLEPSVFQTKAENKGFIIQDITEKYDAEVTTIVLLGFHSDYSITYYKLNTKENADKFYRMLQKKAEEEKNTKKKERKNKNQYILETEKDYKMISKIDTTILFGEAPMQHKKMLEEDMKSLGYH